MKSEAKPKKQTRVSVMVTFGRGTAELKRQFDLIAKKSGHSKAGLALELIREGIERRIAASKPKPD